MNVSSPPPAGKSPPRARVPRVKGSQGRGKREGEGGEGRRKEGRGKEGRRKEGRGEEREKEGGEEE